MKVKGKKNGKSRAAESVREDVAPYMTAQKKADTLLPYTSFRIQRFRCLKEITIGRAHV